MAETLCANEDKHSVYDAESYENTADIEQAWASKTIEHMEVHYNIIRSVNPMYLKLTPYDDEIYRSFQEAFPDFKLDVLEVESLKSEESKKKWNEFCNAWKDKVQNALFGTLVRIDCSGDYSEENTIFVVRIQFLAIEISRNRVGLNNTVYEENKR